MRRALAVSVLLAIALPLHADTLANLRTLLGTMRATKPVSATVEVQRNRKSSGRFSNQQSSGGASFVVSSDADGLHVTIPQALLDRAAQELRARESDPKKQTPTRAAIDELESSSIAESLHYSPALQALLRIGTLTSEKRGTWNGRPATVLALKLKELIPPQATSTFNVQFQTDQLTLWLADDATPLAAERVRKGTAKFLFLKGEMNSRESWTFARRDDRLVVARFETSFVGSGFGQKGEGKNVTTIALR